MSSSIAEQKVYLVTKPNVDWNQFEVFSTDENLEELSLRELITATEKRTDGDPVDEGAAVTEIAARLCYMSYGKGRKDIAVSA